MAVTVITKSRIGFSTAIIAIVAFGWSEVLSRTRISLRNEAIVCGALALLGLISWLQGRLGEARQAEPLPKTNGNQGAVQFRAADDPEESPFAFFGQGKFWGVILIASAGIMVLLSACVHRIPARLTALLTKATISEPKPVVVTFPVLILQGVISNGIKSSAVINGNNLFLGELIGDVRLQAVGLEEVTVELEGQTKVLVLPAVSRKAHGFVEQPIVNLPRAVPTK